MSKISDEDIENGIKEASYQFKNCGLTSEQAINAMNQLAKAGAVL